METKVCSICKKEKNVSEYRKRSDSKDGFRTECKECSYLMWEKYRDKNKNLLKEKKSKDYYDNREKYLKKAHDYRIKNIDKVKEKDRLRSKKKYLENPERIRIYYKLNKSTISEQKKLWAEKNKEKLKIQKKEYVAKRKKEDILYYLKSICRLRLYHFLKTRNISKKNSTFDIVGCTPQQLKEHLERQFISGMTWENRSEWHIDHIVPLSSAKTEEELYKLCHYTNLQPLWAEDNIKKSNKIVEPINIIFND